MPIRLSMKLPTFTLIAGANGAGKSTLTTAGGLHFHTLPLLNPDTFTHPIQVDHFATSALAAGRETLKKANAYLRTGESFAVETTLSGHNYLRMMVEARKLGFRVILIYVGTVDVRVNIERVSKRVFFGGPNVPEIDIRRRYERSLRNLPIAVSLADQAILLDNSSEQGYEPVAYFDRGKAQWFQPAPTWARHLVVKD